MSLFTNRIFAIVLVGAIASAIFVTLSASSDGEGAQGLIATPSVEFETFEGETVALSDFEGKPVVLNFWASWCPACAAEMPDFEQVHQALGDDVTFIGVDMQDISRDAALQLVEETGVSYQLVDDPIGAVYSQFGGLAMPTTVFIDAQGRIVDTHAGALFAADLAERVETLLLGA